MNKRPIIILTLLALVAVLPFVLKKQEAALLNPGDDTLVIITPHVATIRYEFEYGFKKWYQEKYGRTVDIDWRNIGGSQEVMRFINSSFRNSFQLYWERDLGREWNERVEEAYNNPAIELPSDPAQDNLSQEARRAFLESKVTAGLDMLFGGGEIEIVDQAEKGHLVPTDIVKNHPEWFDEDSFPRYIGGTSFWDPEGKWVGFAHSGFGIIFNRDVLKERNVKHEPRVWADLSIDELWGDVALADPSVSASSNRAFDMLVQQQMLELKKELDKAEPGKDHEQEAIVKGWERGLRLVQSIASNARYFTDSSTKPVLDVSSGNCAAGMSVDFYGLFQEQNLKVRSNSDRFGFAMPKGGGVVTPDSFGILRGAPNKDVAMAFMEFVLSETGQKLWAFKVGAPGGPVRYTLNRPPVRKEIYTEEYRQYRTHPSIDNFRDVGEFIYHPDWTSKVFKSLRFIIKAAFVDPHTELARARKAIIEAKKEGRMDDALKAMAVMGNLDVVSYSKSAEDIRNVISSRDALALIRLQGALTQHFSDQYRQAEKIARGQGS